MDLEKYRRLFLEEARENLRIFVQSSLAMEQHASADISAGLGEGNVIHELFRAAHSMKGMAASLGYTVFADVAHGLEDLADRSRQGDPLTSADVDLLLCGGDVLATFLDQIQEDDPLDPHVAADLLQKIRTRLAADTVQLGRPLASKSSTNATRAGVDPVSAPSLAIGEVALQVWLEAGLSMPKARAFLVHRQVSHFDNFLRADPSPETWSERHEKPGYLWFVFRVEGLAREQVGASVAGMSGVDRVHWLTEQELAPPEGAQDVLVAPAGRAIEAGLAPPERSEKKGWERSVRVRAGLLDGFMDSVSELLLTRAKLRAVAARSQDNDLSDLVDEIERQVRDLHARVVAARMTPLHFMTDSIPRSVRDIAKRTQKEVQVKIDGAHIEVDRAILEELHTPMIHLLRNAIDHGHEGDEARNSAGKPTQMTIRLSARRADEHLVLLFMDDGAGIDLDRVARRAVDMGLVHSEQIADLDESQILDFICAPGFSTKLQVTDISGRGVGMDVVKQGVERLGGKLRIHSLVGKGTRVEIHVPLTVSLMQVLLIEAQVPSGRGQVHSQAQDESNDRRVAGFPLPAREVQIPVFAIAAQRVLRIVPLSTHVSLDSQGARCLSVDGRDFPLYDLAETLGYQADVQDEGIAFLVENGAEQVAFRAARITGQEEVVAKSLGFPLSRIPYLAGAALLADGRAAYILEPSRLPLRGTALD